MPAPDLHAYPVFADLPARAAEVLQNRFEDQAYTAGEVIIRRGVHAGIFAVITTGRVTCSRAEAPDEELGSGACFGSDMLARDAASDATYRAVEPTTLQLLRRADWLAATATPSLKRQRDLRWVAGLALILAVTAAVIAPPALTALARDRAANAIQTGRPATAETYLRLALRVQPHAAALHDALGSALYLQGELDAAADEFEQAIALDPDLAAAQNNLGAALVEKKEPAQAVGYLQRAVTLNPASADSFANLGNAYLASGQRDAAAAAYQRAFELDPMQVDARAAWAAIVFGWGHFDQARQAWQTALDAQPGQALALSGLGALAVREGRAEAALSQLQAALAADPGQAETSYYLGLAYEALQRPAAAVQAFERALAASSDPELIRLARAHLQALYTQAP